MYSQACDKRVQKTGGRQSSRGVIGSLSEETWISQDKGGELSVKFKLHVSMQIWIVNAIPKTIKIESKLQTNREEKI